MATRTRASHGLICAVALLAGCRALPESPPPEAMFPTLKLNPDLLRPLAPSNDRDWTPEQAKLATAQLDDNRVTVRNIRDCRWRTADDFTVSYYDRAFDLDRLSSVDFIVVPFNQTPSLGHTMLSFGFDDGQHLAVSVEIRKERGQKFSALGGFFRQYGLIYVVASERDVIEKRVLCDRSDVYLYHCTATPQQARQLFVDVMRRADKLSREPEFYNTLTNNCTTNIRSHVNHLKPDEVPYDYRVLLPGLSDELAYDLGLIEHHGTYAETRLHARVNYQAYLHRDDPLFSESIRR